MTQLAAILIVLTLTGEPVTNALCITWCDQPSERQHCSDVIAQNASPAFSGADGTCAALLTASPFLREEGQNAYPAIAPATRPAVGCAIEIRLARPRASGDLRPEQGQAYKRLAPIAPEHPVVPADAPAALRQLPLEPSETVSSAG